MLTLEVNKQHSNTGETVFVLRLELLSTRGVVLVVAVVQSELLALQWPSPAVVAMCSGKCVSVDTQGLYESSKSFRFALNIRSRKGRQNLNCQCGTSVKI